MRLIIAALLSVLLLGCSNVEDLLNKDQPTLPVINSITPDSGKPGATVVVQGANFGTAQGTVAFEDRNSSFMAAPVVTWTDTTVVITVPTMPSGVQAAKVGMQTASGQVPALPFTFNVTSATP